MKMIELVLCLHGSVPKRILLKGKAKSNLSHRYPTRQELNSGFWRRAEKIIATPGTPGRDVVYRSVFPNIFFGFPVARTPISHWVRGRGKESSWAWELISSLPWHSSRYLSRQDLIMGPQDFKSDVLSTGHAASSVANVPWFSRYLRRHVEFKLTCFSVVSGSVSLAWCALYASQISWRKRKETYMNVASGWNEGKQFHY